MQRNTLSLLALWILISPAFAADRKFPYEAIVDIAEEFVRSGPGQKFYPTSKIHKGDRVTVHRHDPGGWVMIAPPEGSFSWIQSEYVTRQAGDQGTLTQNNVIVRVGSAFNDERDWYQRELNKGDTVEILGERSFETDRGPVKMLQIKPPANEYRWIMGRALVPADAPVRQPLRQGDVAEAPVRAKSISPLDNPDVDPFAVGPSMTPPVAETPIAKVSVLESKSESVRQTGPATEDLHQWRTQLSSIDEAFRTMIKADPQTWDLASLEQQYQQLEGTAELPVLKTQLQQRLAAVAKYAKIKTEYEAFVRVTSETKQRDAQLMSMTNAAPAASAPTSPQPNLATAQPPRAPTLPNAFDGAGIVQRTGPNGGAKPKFVLTSPDGRLLAYLQPAPGVDLNAYVGQAMGVLGQRSFRPELQGEMIVVRSLTPVRLRGMP